MNGLKRYSKILLFSVGFLVTGLLAGCGGGGDQGRDPILGLPSADLVTVVVTPKTASAAIGGVQQFVATANFADGSSRDVSANASWTSAATAVATVNAANGLASGVAAGTSAIGATFNGKAGSATLTVGSATLRSIAVTPANPTIGIGASQQFLAMGTFSDGSSRDITAISAFTSARPAAATINATGLATGVAAGTSFISATSGALTGSAILTVSQATLVSIALSPVDPMVPVGAVRQLTLSATYSDNTTVNVASGVSFSSASPAVAGVNASTGLVTGLAGGTSIISASFGGKSVSTSVTVPSSSAQLTAITVTPATANIGIGASQRFIATATYADNSTADISATASWTSSDTAVASVLPNGVASGASAGKANITATSGGKSSTGFLTVSAPVTLSRLSVTPIDSTLTVGANSQLTATEIYSDGTTVDVTRLSSWSVANSNIATVDQFGRASAVAAGEVIVTASRNGSIGGAKLVVVNPAPAPVPTDPGSPPPVVVPVPGTPSNPGPAPATGAINLGGAANFGVLAATSITNNSGGTTLVTGDVGSPSQTTDPTQAAGYQNYKSGAILTTALSDLQKAITDANSRPCTVNSASGIDLGGLALPPGVYCYAGGISITGTFMMTGPGLYIFRTSSTLNSTANSIVALTGGATADSLFWVPGGATTLGANSVFKGTIMGASAAITLGDNASLQNGRVLTGAAATLRNNAISK